MFKVLLITAVVATVYARPQEGHDHSQGHAYSSQSIVLHQAHETKHEPHHEHHHQEHEDYHKHEEYKKNEHHLHHEHHVDYYYIKEKYIKDTPNHCSSRDGLCRTPRGTWSRSWSCILFTEHSTSPGSRD
ncbi:unnamed protein product [Arctia plantaginis]|uniref:Uncharacterized protein n=1 Tax=Arctia plantaginis TaxID=874455 RepID=A0A8S1A7R8_ARCPL|nr:unnamed protein product [Arctia plantaginis]